MVVGLLTATIFLALPGRASAEGAAKAPAKKNLPADLESKDLARVVASEVVSSSNGPGALGLLLSGRHMALWGDWPGKAQSRPKAPEKTPALNARWFGVIRDLKPSDNSRAANRELQFRNAVLVLAAKTTSEALATSARENRGTTVEKLLREPRVYRGKVVQVRGRLKHLWVEDAPEILKNQGIDKLYEGWIFTDDLGTSPAAVMFTDLPAKMKTGENIDYPVVFNGYFFKKQVDDTRELRVMPLLLGQSIQLWKGRLTKHDRDLAPSINHLLINVEDKKGIPATPEKNVEEVWAYAETIALASRTPDEAFEHSARQNSSVTWLHLMRNPAKYRGKVVSVRGRLRRLRRLDVPRFMEARGIKTLYEGWVFVNPRWGFCTAFTELPPDLKVGEDVDYPVAFDGYFFKKYRYDPVQGDRFAPLLVGRTIHRQGKPPPSRLASSFSTGFVVGLTGLITGTILVVVGLGWWFRRGDRRLHRRLAELHGEPVLEPSGEAPPAAGGPPEGIHGNLPPDEGFRPNSL
jgi:hypothetical protein